MFHARAPRVLTTFSSGPVWGDSLWGGDATTDADALVAAADTDSPSLVSAVLPGGGLFELTPFSAGPSDAPTDPVPTSVAVRVTASRWHKVFLQVTSVPETTAVRVAATPTAKFAPDVDPDAAPTDRR